MFATQLISNHRYLLTAAARVHEGLAGRVRYETLLCRWARRESGRVLVLHLLDIAEQEDFAKRWLKLFESGLQSHLIVDTDGDFLRTRAGCGNIECGGVVFKKNSTGSGDTGSRGEESITQNMKYPSLEVGGWLKSVKGAKCFGEGLLNDVFCLGAVAGQLKGVVVERNQERQREFLKGCALRGGRRHSAGCLGQYEGAWFQQHRG
jgi:hypothetical protein